MTETFQRIAELAARRYGRDRAALGPEDDLFAALDIDSFEALEFVTQLEVELGVEIPDHELLGLRTLGQLAQAIERRR